MTTFVSLMLRIGRDASPGKGPRSDSDLPVLVLVLLVDRRHECGGRRQQLIDEDEDGLVGGQLDALADDVDELADGEVGRD